MFNPIEAKKRLVLERLQKSFDNEVVEKAYQVGDEKQFNGRTYYVNALNAKGQPLWRLKRDGAKKDEEDGGDEKVAKPDGKESISNQASWASDDALKRAAADENAKPEVREAAKKELAKREAHQKELAKRSGKKVEEKMKNAKEVYDKAHDNASNSSSDNSNSVSEDDVKSFLTQKLGADNVNDKLISGVMEVVKNNTKVNESNGEKLIDTALQQMGYESGHKFENRGEYAKKLSDWVNKFALKNDKSPSDMVDWLNDNMETLYNLDDLDDDELDKFSNIEGWDELNDIINDMSDAFENPDTEEADFENMFLGALKSDMGELDNSRKGKAAQKKLVDLARDFVNKNPDLKLTAEDWQDIIGGDVDESDEKYGKLKGFRKLSNAIEDFYDSVD